MGEVYRARDTRLDRVVAIKVLPSRASLSQSLLQRFEREAKTISALSHPHICALHDVGREDGIDYLVMEYCDGETLAARLAKGALPVDQVIRYGAQIADAVDKAHRQGIVHRDLKPGNIILTKNGAKLLDFGLAKLVTGGTNELAVDAVTVQGNAEPLTEEGMVIGTFQYMAPEQLEGKPADARTDVFALGTVLYEMATGVKAFSGKSRASLIASILEHRPEPITQREPATPPALDHVVQRCLEKDPENRWQSARDIVAELQWIEAAGSQAGVAAPVAWRRRKREATAWIAAAIFGIAVLASSFLWLRREAEPPGLIRLTIPRVTQQYQNAGENKVSPDGKQVVFVAFSKPNRERLIWVRPLDSFEARPLNGTLNGSDPFWSADSRKIGFFANEELKIVSAEGGAIQSVAKVGPLNTISGATWSEGGWILFANGQMGIQKVSVSGGELKTITKINRDQNEHAHLWPHFLPDGKRFLFLGNVLGSTNASQSHRLYVGSIETETTTLLGDLPSAPAFVKGFLLFVHEGNLMAQRFDPNQLRFSGEPQLVAGPVYYFRPTGYRAFSCSENGVVVFTPPAEARRLVKVDKSGQILEQIGEIGNFENVTVSDSGDRAVVGREDLRNGTLDLWVYGLNRKIKSRITFEPGWEGTPIWAPDGSSVYFASDRKGWPDIYRKDLAGSGDYVEVLIADGTQLSNDISPDGRFLLYTEIKTGQAVNVDVLVLPLEKNGKPRAVAQTPFNEADARFSPDGKWVSFTSNENGQSQVYITPFPGLGSKMPISTEGGTTARWSRDGKRLYFKNRKDLMFVDLEEVVRSKTVSPVRLFESSSEFGNFEALESEEFLMITSDELLSQAPVHVILNWQSAPGWK